MESVAMAVPGFGGLPPGVVQFLPFVLIIAVFYMLMIRPNQKRQKVWQEMLSNIKPGDKVTTSGGIRGTIYALRDDAVQLRVPPDNLKIEVLKSAISAVTAPEEEK
jgi:preprotein translocase subunit YajC